MTEDAWIDGFNAGQKEAFSDEAIENAARAIFDLRHDAADWPNEQTRNNLWRQLRLHYVAEARVALRAALPGRWTQEEIDGVRARAKEKAEIIAGLVEDEDKPAVIWAGERVEPTDEQVEAATLAIVTRYPNLNASLNDDYRVFLSDCRADAKAALIAAFAVRPSQPATKD